MIQFDEMTILMLIFAGLFLYFAGLSVYLYRRRGINRVKERIEKHYYNRSAAGNTKGFSGKVKNPASKFMRKQMKNM
jgi:hypothetical protein